MRGTDKFYVDTSVLVTLSLNEPHRVAVAIWCAPERATSLPRRHALPEKGALTVIASSSGWVTSTRHSASHQRRHRAPRGSLPDRLAAPHHAHRHGSAERDLSP